jgi:hypothetical protein
MLLAFCGVLAICTLGYLMDRCTNSVVAVSQNQTLSSTALQTELDIYIDRDSKDVNAFIKGNKARSNTENQGVFSTLWVFASGRFHNAATQLLDLSKANFYANVKNALDNVWLCVRAVGWAFRFHPIYSAIYFSISFLIFVFSVIALGIGGGVCICGDSPGNGCGDPICWRVVDGAFIWLCIILRLSGHADGLGDSVRRTAAVSVDCL